MASDPAVPERGSPVDVAVVGGGVIGLASAWRLAQRGLSVTVFDPEPGGGASSVAAGMLAPVTEARLGEEQLLQLGLASLARWNGFADELEDASGASIGYRADGTVVVAYDADDRALLGDVMDRERSMGLSVEDLSSQALRKVEPGLAPQVRRGAFAADERSVDPVSLVAALAAAVDNAGVEIRRQRVAALDVVDRAGRDHPGGDESAPLSVGENNPDGPVVARGVVLDDAERVAAGAVVLAAGSWSPGVTGLAPVAVPVRPVKGQVVTLHQRPADIVVRHTVRGYVRGAAIYLVPRDDGRLVCGATVEERGWDATVTAGGAYELLRDVLSLFPGLDEAELVGVRSGFRPGTPDDRPLLGPSGVDGLIMATGHYRNGILLTPVSAEAVADFVTGGTPPPEAISCDPRRFAKDTVPSMELPR